MTLEYKYLYFNLSPFNIWQDDTPTLVPSTGNLITVPSTGTYSTSITTNQTAASGFICCRWSNKTASTDS